MLVSIPRRLMIMDLDDDWGYPHCRKPPYFGGNPKFYNANLGFPISFYKWEIGFPLSVLYRISHDIHGLPVCSTNHYRVGPYGLLSWYTTPIVLFMGNVTKGIINQYNWATNPTPEWLNAEYTHDSPINAHG